MGCCCSKVDREETVSRCKARKRYMKELVKARQALSASHAMYLRSLRGTGSALLQFSTNEAPLHLHTPICPQVLPPPPPLPPRPPLSPSTDTWTSSASPLLPPPPPPPPPSSSWDFWDPFVPSSSRSVTEEEWEEEVTTTMSDHVPLNRAESVMEQPSSVVSGFSKDTSGSELAMVVSRNSKDLVEIVKEVDEYFLKAADAGAELSSILEVSSSSFSSQSKGGS